MVLVVTEVEMQRVRYVGSMYPAGVIGPGGVRFLETGDEGDVPVEWAETMIGTGQFASVEPDEFEQQADGDEPEGSR